MKTYTVDPAAFEEHGAVRRAWSGTTIDHPKKGELPTIKAPMKLGGKLYTVTSIGMDTADASALIPVETAPAPSDNKATAPRRVGLVVTYRGKFYRIGAQVRIQGIPGGEAAGLDEPGEEPAPAGKRRPSGKRAQAGATAKAGEAKGQATSPAPSTSPDGSRCGDCDGQGRRRVIFSAGLDPSWTTTCTTCGGSGVLAPSPAPSAPDEKRLVEYTDADWAAAGASSAEPVHAPSTPESFACIRCGGPAARAGIRCEACDAQHMTEVRERVLAERAQREVTPTGATVVHPVRDFARPGEPCRTCAGTGMRTNQPAGAFEQIYTAPCFNCGGAGIEPGLAQIEPTSIDANPLNPRRNFEETGIAELAASIRQHGLIEPLVVTAQPDGRFLLIAGERRLMAAGVAQLTRVPAVIRRPAEAAEQLALMLCENLQREDLNPMEEARAFRDLRELGWKQTAIAEACGKSQPRVAQSLSLLDLPESVQAMVADGRLSFAHGRTLARFAPFPEVCAFIAERAVAAGAASKELEKQTMPYGWDLHSAGFIQNFYTHSTPIDVEAHCRQCPWQAFRGDGAYNAFCLKPEHYRELVAEAQAEENARRLISAREAQESLRRQQEEIQRLREEGSLAGAKGGAVATDPDMESGAPALLDLPVLPAEALPIPETPEEIAAAIAALPDLESLPKEQATPIERWDTPKSCTPACACRALARDAHGRVVPICTDPKRLRRLKKQENAAEKQAKADALEARWAGAFAALGTTPEGLVDIMHPRAIAPLIQDRLQGHDKARVAGVLARLGLDLDANVLTQYRYRSYQPAWDDLAQVPVESQLRLLLLCELEKERFEALEYAGERTPILRWLSGVAETPEPEPIYTCATCGATVEQEAVTEGLTEWESETMCGDCYDRLLAEGKIDLEGNWLAAPEESALAAANEEDDGGE